MHPNLKTRHNTMKRLFLILTTVLVAISAAAQLKVPSATIKGNLKGYKYVYVIPSSGVTSSSGSGGAVSIHHGPYVSSVYSTNDPITTVNPSETIKGYLIRMGYTILPSINQDLANKTLIVSYGHTGYRALFWGGYASSIVLQISEAKTNNVLAIYETEGYGSNESKAVISAVYSALDLFYYSVYPKITQSIINVSKRRVELELTNRTPYYIEKLKVRLTYYLEGEYICEQEDIFKTKLVQGETINVNVKRIKPARNTKYQIKVEVVDCH